MYTGQKQEYSSLKQSFEWGMIQKIDKRQDYKTKTIDKNQNKSLTTNISKTRLTIYFGTIVIL